MHDVHKYPPCERGCPKWEGGCISGKVSEGRNDRSPSQLASSLPGSRGHQSTISHRLTTGPTNRRNGPTVHIFSSRFISSYSKLLYRRSARRQVARSTTECRRMRLLTYLLVLLCRPTGRRQPEMSASTSECSFQLLRLALPISIQSILEAVHSWGLHHALG